MSGELCLARCRGGLTTSDWADLDCTRAGLKSGESCLLRLGGLLSVESCRFLEFPGGDRSGDWTFVSVPVPLPSL